ncbi:unnamed protein product, partial [Mesorhabditis spiculigera]
MGILYLLVFVFLITVNGVVAENQGNGLVTDVGSSFKVLGSNEELTVGGDEPAADDLPARLLNMDSMRIAMDYLRRQREKDSLN